MIKQWFYLIYITFHLNINYTSYIVPQVSFNVFFSYKFQMWKFLFFSFFLGGRGGNLDQFDVFKDTDNQVIKKGLQILTISDLCERQNDECWKQAKSYNEFLIKQQFIMDWHYSVCTLWKCNIPQFYMTSNSAQQHILNHPTRGLNISLFQTNVQFLYPT